MYLTVLSFFTGATLIALTVLRIWDTLADRREMDRLRALCPKTPKRFSRSMISGLPEPARRYFNFSIHEGSRILPVVELSMNGLFSLGSKERPEYMQMQAHQVLAPPNGFVWKMRARSRYLRLSGSDSGYWTRFWMGGVIPVARQGGSVDHALASFGRGVGEAVFWAPASLLPASNVVWEEAGTDTAKVTVQHGEQIQSVEILVAPDGQPLQVSFERWSNANPEKTFQFQPFGGYLSEFRTVQGYQIPTHVEAGNFFGTDAYFPFFIVDVTEITFPH